MKEIQLHGMKAAGRVALVDDEDYALVAQFRWHCFEPPTHPGCRNNGPYAKTQQPCWPGQPARRDEAGRVIRVKIVMHQLILGIKGIDHINHDGLDNRRANLRPATKSQNAQNKRSELGSNSQYRGVSWDKRKRKWQVMIMINGKYTYIGLFADEVEAARAYDAAAVEAFGEYALINLRSA